MASFTLTNGDDIFPGAVDNSGDDTINALGGDDFVSAGDGNDQVLGGNGDDKLFGQIGNDLLFGQAGADKLVGGNGDDTLEGGEGADSLDGSLGFDVASYVKSKAGVGIDLITGLNTGDALGDTFLSIERFNLTDFNDTLTAGASDSVIYSYVGDDLITTAGGIDQLHGGDGNDTLQSGDGADQVFGENGADRLVGGNGDDTLQGGAGQDILLGGAGADDLEGGAAFDTASYGNALGGVTINLKNGARAGEALGDTFGSIEQFALSNFDDVFVAKNKQTVLGLGGNDSITGGAKADELHGGDGGDTLNGGLGDDKLFGENNDDSLNGGAGADSIDGGLGFDTVSFSSVGAVSIDLLGGVHTGEAAGDVYTSIEQFNLTALNDTFIGATQAVTVFGLGGDDTLTGGDGADSLNGGGGRDSLVGGLQNDTLDGSLGRDTLIGGAGADTLRGETAGLALASLSTLSAQGDGSSHHIDLSSDGRYVSFTSVADNLNASDPDGAGPSIFLRDLVTGVTQYAGAGYFSDVSDGGAYVALQSAPPNAILRDIGGGVNLTTVAGGGSPSLSADGRYMATYDAAGTFPQMIRVYDRVAGTSNLVTSGANNSSLLPELSSDGRYVVFYSYANSLGVTDSNGQADIYWKDLVTNDLKLVSTSSTGVQANGASQEADVSGGATQGRYVVFASDATNLVSNDDNGVTDIFVKDVLTGAITRVSTGSDGSEANGSSREVQISDDGRFVVFTSDASNLVRGDINNASDVFMHDMLTGATTRLSATGGSGGNRASSLGAINADGLVVAFQSDANNLAGGDINGRGDIFFLTGDDLRGGAGDDLYVVRSVLDRVTENPNEGTDSVATALGQYVLTPNVEGLFYNGTGSFDGRGNAGDNIIVGGAGNDTLAGAGGSDTLTGNGGPDAFAFSIVDDAQTNQTFRDTISDFLSGQDSLRVDFGVVSSSFTLATGQTDATLGQVQYVAAQQRMIFQGAAAGADSDLVINSATAPGLNDIDVVLKAQGAVNITTAGGDDQITGVGVFNNLISTGAGADLIAGGDGDDTIDAGTGNDTLNGGGGADSLTGGTGQDLFLYFLPNGPGPSDQQGAGLVRDTITDFQSHSDHLRIDFGDQGAPLFVMTDGVADGNFSFGNMHYDSAAHQLIVQGYGTGSDVDLVINSAGAIDIANDIDVVLRIGRPDMAMTVTTLGGNDLIGLSEYFIKNDTVDSGAGNDTVDGGAGDDLIIGGRGADQLSGGTGADTFYYVLASDSQGGSLVRDNLTDFISGEDRLRIDFGTQSGGFAVTDGTNDGVAGNVHYDSATHTFIIQGSGAGGAGDVVINSTGAIALSDIDTVVSIMQTTQFTGFGGDDQITAVDHDVFDNLLNGAAGDDTLSGGRGNDRLLGGQGNDALNGGAENDSVDGGLGDDLVTGGFGADVLRGGDGDDTVDGGAGNDQLFDDFGLDLLVAGDGNDRIRTNGLQAGEKVDLGFGDDDILFLGSAGQTLRLDDSNFLDGGGRLSDGENVIPDSGRLTVAIAGGHDPINVNLQGLTGFSGLSRGAILLGNKGINQLTGTGYADLIRGEAGDDILFGSSGADTLVGGDGSDIYVIKGFSSRATDHDGSFEGVTLHGVKATGLDRIMIGAGATGGIDMVSAMDIDGSDVTWANFASSLGQAIGSDFFDPESPLQGHNGIVVHIHGGEAQGDYLVTDRLGVNLAGYQAQFDSVMRLEKVSGQIDDSDFIYLRTASGQQGFVGQTGNTDVLDYTMLSDGSVGLAAADTVTGMDFDGEDKLQFRSSAFGGLTHLDGHNMFLTARPGADLSAASEADQAVIDEGGTTPVASQLSAAIAELVEDRLGHAVKGAFFAIVYDADTAHGGANAATYLVFDSNGTDEGGTVGGQDSGAQPDITVVARFDTTPGHLNVDASDIWFDVDINDVGATDALVI